MIREIWVPFLLGLTIFLFGLFVLRAGLEKLAGDRLQKLLLRFTKTTGRSFLTGIVTTALLQSSTAITVLTISFVNAGILSFAQSIGIILGTNIGTTVTTQMLTLNIEQFAVPLVVLGAVCYLLPRRNLSFVGMVIGGLGCIFLGMETMQTIAQPLKEIGWIDQLVGASGNLVWTGVWVGALLTAMIHSGSAVIAMTMGFYAHGVITLPFALAVVLGSNVGTCVTGVIATFGTNRAAKHVALAHVLLNVVGVALFAPLVPWMSEVLAPTLSANPATQLAHVQTLFNVVCSLAVLPFAGPFARVVAWMIPERG